MVKTVNLELKVIAFNLRFQSYVSKISNPPFKIDV